MLVLKDASLVPIQSRHASHVASATKVGPSLHFGAASSCLVGVINRLLGTDVLSACVSGSTALDAKHSDIKVKSVSLKAQICAKADCSTYRAIGISFSFALNIAPPLVTTPKPTAVTENDSFSWCCPRVASTLVLFEARNPCVLTFDLHSHVATIVSYLQMIEGKLSDLQISAAGQLYRAL